MNFRNTGFISLAAVLFVGCALPVKNHQHAVCHKGKTLYVDEAAVDAHIRHGDYGRACYGEKKKDHDDHDHDHDKRGRDDRD